MYSTVSKTTHSKSCGGVHLSYRDRRVSTSLCHVLSSLRALNCTCRCTYFASLNSWYLSFFNPNPGCNPNPWKNNWSSQTFGRDGPASFSQRCRRPWRPGTRRQRFGLSARDISGRRRTFTCSARMTIPLPTSQGWFVAIVVDNVLWLFCVFFWRTAIFRIFCFMPN